ncbi:RINT-1 / TIP-1 family protein [Candida parapsilosis]|uniref:RINT-1 / TIP-1 family protein n=1 Tax=Candida parapsilosis TaxID=5480 RepID=A0A8X7NJZ8_CANPA|nr:RINT-1 / TIP-1 family protein [Candida parapsilosis]KAF6044957.1 RINT-1 / TIP-1 family protein [Candida parapsilosis]KAF6048897.1 RINT-1 / TIP-1 family protein [Candida parapsilosis]KAF6060897.1 RINT-1 / TIP-1 family protein [Candida parapsilosis]KAI5904731.1 hypothetical protein K4G60_g3889 [Candida parapsilosis]
MEVSNYVDANFTSIEDLSLIESKLDELRGIDKQVKTVVANRLSNSSESHFQKELKPDIDDSKLNDAVEKIVSVVQVVTSLDDLNEAYDNIHALILEFGDIPLLREIQVQLKKKQVAEIQTEYLLKYQQIESKLTEDASLEDLRAISSQINEMHAPELVSQVDQEINRRSANLEGELQSLIKENKWLSKTTVSNAALTSITKISESLIELQSIRNSPSYPDTWWALERLLEPVITRFHYHFDTPNKDTNKLSKPEWALNFIENFLEDNLPLLNTVVDQQFKKIHRIGTYEIITTLLVPVRNKMNKVIKVINTNLKSEYDNKVREKYGVLLSHLVFELSSFDQRLRNKYRYNPFATDSSGPVVEKWTGITGDIFLDEKNRAFESWLEFEKTLAVKRFNSEIINTNDWIKVDFDYQPHKLSNEDPSARRRYLRPTFSAYGLVKLIENLNTHFQTLRIVKFQLKYVSSIQLHLLELYLGELTQEHKTFTDQNTKSVLTMIPGGIETNAKNSNKREADIIVSLEKLTEIYCSTKFVNNWIQKWNEDLVFIQLWKLYQSFSSSDLDADMNDGLFSSISTKYDKLSDKTLDSYLGILRVEIKQLLKAFVNTSQWDLANPETDLLPSKELNSIINTLPNYLDIIEKSVSKVDYFAVSNMAVTIISELLYEYVITNNRFSRTGIDQLILDFNYLVSSLHATLLLNTRRSSSITRLDDNSLSNDGNRGYVKVVQAIDILDSVSPSLAAEIKHQDRAIDNLRKDYGHGIGAMKNSEIKDLLNRII